MSRGNYLYDEERPLPYLVQLVRIDGVQTGALPRQNPPALMHLDLRGGQFSRDSSYRLARTFDWLTRAWRIRKTELDEYALMISPVPPRDDEEIVGGRVPYIPDDWPDLQKRSFLWVPVAYSDTEERYAWQK